MDFLLISPPVANFAQAPAALSVLTAYLRACGWDAQQWDLGLEAFHHFHSAEHLCSCREVVIERSRDEELLAVAERAVTDIDAAKSALREPGIARDRERLGWALHTVRDAGVLLTAASLGRFEHDFRNYGVPGALGSFELLEAALGQQEHSPLSRFFEERLSRRLDCERPRALGISVSYLSQLLPALLLLRLVRARLPEVPVIAGGAYLTATSHEIERVPTSILPADAVVLHDGELALDAWLSAVLRDNRQPGEIANLYLPAGGRFRRAWRGPVRQTDLDALPVPLWTAAGLELDQYLVPQYAVGLPLSRGCHWGRCAYCNISSQAASSYRCRSAAKAVADITAAIDETGSRWFDLSVDSYRPQDLRALAQALGAAGVAIEWGAEVLLDRGLSAEVLAELARSGCRCLRFGLESACPETLRRMGKPTRPGLARRILGACREHGIRTAVMLIVGFPTETQAGLEQTFDFLVDNRDRIDFLTFHHYSLVPGSPMAADPGAFGLYRQGRQPVFSPNLPFVNTNPGGLQSEHVPQVIAALRDGLREHYPDLGELWAAGIGGWLTFAACCQPASPGRRPSQAKVTGV